MITQPDSGTQAEIGKMALMALLACGLFITIGLFSPGLVLPQIAQAFAQTPHAPLLTEMIGAIAGFSFALGAPLAGILIGRIGCQRVILPALLAFAFFGTLPVVLDDLWLIVASRVMVGLATSAIFTAALAGIGSLPDAARAKLFGWFAVVGGVAAIVLFPIVGMLGHMGWRPAFLVHLCSLLVVPLIFAIPAALGRRTEADDAAAAATRTPFLNAAMVGVLVIAGLTGMSLMLSPIYGPIYLASLGVTDTRLAAIPLTVGAVAAVFASAGYGPLYRRAGVMGVFVLATAIMAAMLILTGFTTNVIIFTAAMAAVSGMVALLGPNLNAAAIAFSTPQRAAQAIGLVNGMMFGAQLLFPFVASWVRGMVGLSGVFVAFGLAMGAVALLATGRRLVAAKALAC